MNYKIIKFDYKLINPYKPGKCIKINNEFYCIFEYEKNNFKILVKNDSKLLNTNKFDIVELEETGFQYDHIPNEKILVIAAGTGISAIINFIKTYIYKTNILFIYYTKINFNLNDYFSEEELKNFHFIIWNTSILNRPKNPVLNQDIHNTKIIAAGPKVLIDDLKNISKNIYLNY